MELKGNIISQTGLALRACALFYAEQAERRGTL